MAVALTALFVSLGGVGYAAATIGSAQIKNNTVRSKDVRNGTLRTKDHKPDSLGGVAIKESALGLVPGSAVAIGAARHAVVNAGGQLVRGRNVTSVARTGAGRYQVIFNGDVRACAYFASIGDSSATPLGAGSQITTASLASNVNGVSVRTWGPDGAQTGDRPFHLILSC
jgi:hypothetical protein